MVDLKAQMVTDAEDTFANGDEFAEEIFYYPAGDTGDKRTFDAIVDRRDEVELLGLEEGDVLTLEAVIEIPNTTDNAKGLAGDDTPDPGVDLVDVVLRPGDAKTRCRVIRKISSDPGMHVVGVIK